MRAARMDRRAVLRLGVIGVALGAAGCAAGGVSTPSGWPGVGATGSGPAAGCPPIMSHFEDWTSKYGAQDRRMSGDPPWNKPHNGIDFDVPVGTPVLAVAPGQVTPIMYSTLSPIGAINMVVYHGQDADGRHVFSFYTHLAEQRKRPGERVARGEVIALSGTSGTRDPHLHLSLWRTPASPGPDFAPMMQQGIGRQDRSILADPAQHWVDPKRPGFDAGRAYPERPIRLTYPLECRSG